MAAKEQLNLKQELFCQCYVKNTALFGNATASYAEAYGYDFDSMSRERVYEEKDGQSTGKILEYSEFDKAQAVCGVNGNKLLRNTKIQDRVTQLLTEMLSDEIVDSQLAKVILQDYKLESKIAGIREYNKLKQRIVEKTDLTSGGKALNIQISEAIAKKNDLNSLTEPNS